ncbi:uncharacterized protein LOC130511154 [Raphanus sativus]|uniref:Uncharacterized protein LOC130511154 n=1 Tax=Raphanus sativus TaxID=3726 RepID=A0A9W3DKP1_RAPSA|nr:uncharacterized protein LOC130511154 [Raphanus sativus]
MDPWVENQERKKMKKMKKHFDMLQFIYDAEHGIPPSCPCGGRIVDEVSTNPTDKDFLPGRRYFTCNEYKNDGFHFRQPWVLGVEEEVRSLRQEVDKMAEEMHKMAEEIAQLKDLLTRNEKPYVVWICVFSFCNKPYVWICGIV